MSLEFAKSEKISLRDHYDEKWLQAKIADDPTILGLGEVLVLSRERKQSSGGRIDFLLHKPEAQTLYEVEVMLGSTDESHIIRTIEYWDIESRKNPSKDHVAVLVAEEITNRFFNVIYLMNRAIPIIAIQLNALRVNGQILLSFTKVLDISETPDDDIELRGEPVNRKYWEDQSSAESMKSVDAVIGLCKSIYPQLRITWNKGHIALGTERQNFCWIYTRKKRAHAYMEVLVGSENLDKGELLLDACDISHSDKENGVIKFPLSDEKVGHNKEQLIEFFDIAIRRYA